ncbi:MAG: hypothetical protein EBR83_10590 [Verrucomicrobia bacterium]|nr:hypothetical protein [Verrucomicrobiota bacterium]
MSKLSLEERFNALQAAFTGKTTEVESKVAEVSALTAKIGELDAVVASKEATLIEMNAKFTEVTEKFAASETLIASLRSELEQAKAAHESAGKKAANIVASVGVNPVEVSPADVAVSAKNDQEIADEWVALKQKDAKEASAFYTANRPAILRASGLK